MSKFVVTINQSAAIRAGNNASGRTTVEVDVAPLAQEIRDVLADAPIAPPDQGGHPMIFGLAEATPEAVIAWAEAKAAQRRIDAELAARNAELTARRVEAVVARLAGMPVERIAASWSSYHGIPMLDLDSSQDDVRIACGDPRLADKIAKAREMAREAMQAKREAEKRAEEARRQAAAQKAAAEAAEKAAREVAERAQIDAWVAEHGTPSQKARHARGMLARDEVLAAMREAAFTPLDDLPRYQRITEAEVLEASNGGYEARFSVSDCATATEEQFALIEQIEAALPGAKVTLRTHIGFADGGDDEDDPVVRRNSALVTIKVGAFEFSREYAAPAS